MSRMSLLQSAFARGEISPLAYGRTQLAQFQVGLKTCLNAIVGERGELHRRPGTRYVSNTKNDAAAVLIPFRFSTEQSYVIEATAGAMRFYTQRGILNDGSNAQASYEIATPFADDEIQSLRWAQVANVLFLVHPNHPPKQLSRLTANTFALVDFSFAIPAWQSINTDIGRTLVMTSGAVTASGFEPFQASDVGRAVRIFDGVWKQHTITEFTSSTTVKVTPARTLPETDLFAFGAFFENNYPSQVVFHENRLVYSATPQEPQTFWMSQTGDYSNFAPTESDGSVIATNAISGTLNDFQVNKIHWTKTQDSNLLMGTESGVWVVRAANAEGISPENVQARRQHATASAALQPAPVGDSLMFLSRSQRKLYALRLDNGLDHYSATDVSLLADHLLQPGALALAYQEAPHRQLWVLRADGCLAAFTYEPGQAMAGWSKHRLGGSFEGGPAMVESLTSIPAPSSADGGAADDLWLVVKRSINGQTRRFVEHLSSYWDHDTPLEQAFFLDAASSYSGPSVTAVSGLEHLIGETIQSLENGTATAQQSLSNPTLNLSQASENLLVGLPYQTDCEVLDLEPRDRDGASMGRSKHLFDISFRFFRSWGLSSGHSFDALRPLAFQTIAASTDPIAFSGVISTKRDEGGWSSAVGLVWRQDQPYPMTLLSVAIRMAIATA